MSREADILAAIDEMNGFDFQKLARRLLKRERFPHLTPLPDQDDLGQDARTDELPVGHLPTMEADDRVTFAISKTNTKTKLTQDCDRCRKMEHDIDTFVFVTSGEVRNTQQKQWKQDIEDEYGWNLVVFERTWFADVVTQPEHEKLIEEVLGIPPLNGDYYADIVEAFAQVTTDTMAGITGTIPHLDRELPRSEVSDIYSRLTAGHSVVVTGQGGVGKTGVLAQLVDEWADTPILFLDARRFAECTTKAELRHVFDFRGPLSEAVARVGRHNQCLVLVDQLDNIGGTPAASVFTDFLTAVSDVDGVHLVAACRHWDLENRRAYAALTDDDAFTTVAVSELTESRVRDVLTDLGITAHSEALIGLGQNLLNLSIIADLQMQTGRPQIDFAAIKTQVELWEQYQETLVEHETRGGDWDDQSGDAVRARAIELAQTGLQDGSRTFPIGIRRDRADERLLSRNVLVNEVGERYRFRHEELQDYFYAWNAVNRRGWTTPREVLDDIDERAAAGVFRWMLRMLLKRDTPSAMAFLADALSQDGLGFYAASHLLDEIATWNPDERADDVVEVALSKIDAHEQFRTYFYTNLETSRWAAILHNRGQFEDPSGPVMTYLERVAPDIPELAVAIVQSTTTDHEGTRAWFVKIAEQLPAEQSADCIDVFTEWLPAANPETGPYTVHYTNLIEALLEEAAVESALTLLAALVEPQPPDPETTEYELENGEVHERTWQTEATALADTHTLETALETVAADLPEEYTTDFIRILEDNLRQAITLEAQVHDVGPGEMPWPRYAGGSGLQNANLKEVLLDTLRTFLTEWIATAPAAPNRRELVARYLTDIPLFRRLGLYLLSRHPTVFPELVREELLTAENYDTLGIKHEFLVLLREGFSVLATAAQERVLAIIEDGPDRDELLETAEAQQDRFHDRDITEVVDEEIDLWTLRRLWMIRDELSDDRAERVEQLVATYGEPTHPETEQSGRMGAVSFEGPMDIDDLRKLDPDEVFELCVNWDPTTSDDETEFLTEISPRGLAQDVQDLIAESPRRFTSHVGILADADPIYIAYALDGLHDALDAGDDFEWDAVLNLCQDAPIGDDAQALASRKRICQLLSTGLVDAESGLAQHYDTVRELLLTLADDPDPAIDDANREYLSHDRPLQTALNAVRPVAVDTLITYALERAKANGFDGFDTEQESGLEPAVRCCLIEKMTDPSTAVHCIFGQRFRNLCWLDRDLVDEQLDTIFPLGDDTEARDRFSAAWAAYLRASPWVGELYHELKDRYRHAVDLHAAEDRFTGHIASAPFVGHTLCPYLHADEPLTADDSLLPYFYANTTPDMAKSAAWQLWQWADDDPDEFRDQQDAVRELWEWRLAKVGEDYEAYADEFQWFVEWLALFSEEIPPTDIQSVVQDTIPFLAYKQRGWKTLEAYLAQWVAEEPHCCIEIYAALLGQPRLPDFVRFEEEAMAILEIALQAGGDTRKLALEVTEQVAEYDQTFLDLLREYSVN